eukprot:57327-Amphidinium_carterae.1
MHICAAYASWHGTWSLPHRHTSWIFEKHSGHNPDQSNKVSNGGGEYIRALFGKTSVKHCNALEACSLWMKRAMCSF